MRQRLPRQPRPRGSQPQAVGPAQEQRQPQRLFQPAHLLADRARGHAQPERGSFQAADLGRNQEDAQGVE
jgi:hypothetical protein